MAFVDFCIVDLGTSKNMAFEFMLTLPLEIFDYPEDYSHLLVNWMALCEQYDIPVASTLARSPDILFMSPDLWTDRIEDLKEVRNTCTYST